MRNTLKEKNLGITLIALVITIIILLILAGISIAMLSGENGILNKTRDAVNEMEKKKLEEIAKIIYNDSIVESLANPNKNVMDMTELLTELSKNGYEVTQASDNIILNGLIIRADAENDLTQEGKNITLLQGSTTESPIQVSLDTEVKNAQYYVKENGMKYR